jgi:hypothetical protein
MTMQQHHDGDDVPRVECRVRSLLVNQKDLGSLLNFETFFKSVT